MLHIKHVPQRSEGDLNGAYDLSGVKIELTGRLFIRGGIIELDSNK